MGNITTVVNNGGLSNADIAAIVAIVLSAIAVVVAIFSSVYSYKVSVKAYGIQSFERYFDINEFVTKHIDILGPFTPLGQCQNKEEATIRVFLYHELNRFVLEKDASQRKRHKDFCRAMYGSSIKNLEVRLKDRGATEETAKLAVNVLNRIHGAEPYYSKKFWAEFFGPDYFK